MDILDYYIIKDAIHIVIRITIYNIYSFKIPYNILRHILFSYKRHLESYI